MEIDVNQILSNLVEEGAISSSSFVGCSASEIAAVEAHFNCDLPKSYRAFLAVAGRAAGKLFKGTDIFYPRLVQLQCEAIRLFLENGVQQTLPENAKVFCMHQGYEVNYFLPGSDNPAVYQYVEGQNSATKSWESFSEFLRQSILQHRMLWPDLS